MKVIESGFVILRKDDYPSPRIKYKGGDAKDWSTLEKFDTKAARDRRYEELMIDEQFIND